MFGGLFGDNSGAFNRAGDAFRQQAGQYNPLIGGAQNAFNKGAEQYNWLVNDPNALQDKVSQGFSQSPYQNYLLNQTTQRMNMNAANNGMIRSPVAQRALNEQLNSLTGQFQNDYINRGMGSYNQGLQGLGQQANMWLPGLQGQSELMGQGIGADLKAAQSQQGGFANMLGGLGGMALNAFGPAGGFTSGWARNMFGGGGDGGGAFTGGGSMNPNASNWTGNTAGSSFNLGQYF